MVLEMVTIPKRKYEELKKKSESYEEELVRERIRKSLDDLKHGRIKEV